MITLNRLTRKTAAACLAALLLTVGGCATGPRLVNHSFDYDVLEDSPGVTLLDYRYGTSSNPGTKRGTLELQNNRALQRQGTAGDMIVGDFLYMKWKINATGNVIEKTVDLKAVLPKDIENTIIYPVIDGETLAVYLVSRQGRPPDFPVVGPRKFRFNKTCILYPTTTCSN